jgi:hypothetical protein
MVKKLDFRRVCIEDYQPEVFETLYNFLSENKLVMSREIKKNIIEHLEGLKLSFKKYFFKPEKENKWISNPFNGEFFQKATSLSIVEKDNLIELSRDTTLKSEFKRKQLINFWVDIRATV